MALSSGSGGGITIAKKVSSNVTLYTVPEGKTFEGHMWNTSSTGPGYINGVQLRWPYNSSYFVQNYLPITLNAGDVVKGDPSGETCIVGVEK
jgi:hypothetical protein